MILIDKLSPLPVYEQVIRGIERGILLGTYPSGTAVPSLRELSVSTGINPNTIQKAYAELTRRGELCPSHGSGSYVTSDALSRIRESALGRLSEFEALAADLYFSGVTSTELEAALGRALRRGTKIPPEGTTENNYEESEGTEDDTGK